jgi:hypothetical protein
VVFFAVIEGEVACERAVVVFFEVTEGEVAC